jgi:predicted amidohydrolase
MRNVKVGAIQSRGIEVPEQYDCNSGHYINDVSAILENYIKKQIAVTTDLLRRAGGERCDIVTTCEDITMISAYVMDITEKNIFQELVRQAEPIVVKELSDIAREHSMYIVGCYLILREGRVYNIASIFDRKGEVVGEYRKTHLPPFEKWQCTPGDDISVFDLDFGRVGLCICYDMMFPEFVQVQALKGAEIIFHPTFGYGWYDSIGEATLRTRANDNGVHIVTAKNYIFNGAGNSSVIDYWGQVLVDAGFYENTIVTKCIDLDVKKTQPDFHFLTHVTGVAELTERKTKERRPDLYGIIAEKCNEVTNELTREEKLSVLEKIKSGECHW